MKDVKTVIKTTDQRTIHSTDHIGIVTNNIIAASRMDGIGFIVTNLTDNQACAKEITINVQHIIYVVEFTQNPIG